MEILIGGILYVKHKPELGLVLEISGPKGMQPVTQASVCQTCCNECVWLGLSLTSRTSVT